LKSELTGAQPPLLIDVRRSSAFRAASDLASGALRRDPAAISAWAKELPRTRSVVVYCVHGHEVSQNTAKALRDAGMAASYLEGGLEEGWKATGGALAGKPTEASTRWVTRERPNRAGAASGRAACGFTGVVPEFQGRPRDAEAGDGDVRRALRLVQGRTGRSAHLESRCVSVTRPGSCAMVFVCISSHPRGSS